MRQKDLLLFIPGTMGSCLRLRSATEDPPTKLWHERPAQSLSQLAKNPVLYKWNPNTSIEAYSVLSHVEYFFRRVDIYGELRNTLQKLEPYEYIEFPYDWRQDIRDTAKQLGNFVSNKLGNYYQYNTRRISIIAHSMGGLIGALALLNAYIPASRIRKFISIATPYYGAPCAFKALSEIGYLPGLTWLDRTLNWRKDRRKCQQILLQAFRSFSSTYQLLPPVGNNYVDLEDGRTTNPLRETVWDRPMSEAAIETHNQLASFPEFLIKNPTIQHHFIYGDYPDNTDRLYSAKVSPCGTAYTDLNCFKTTHGDGTVPVSSSSVKTSAVATAAIVGAIHAYMSVDPRTLELLMAYVTGVAKPTGTGS